MSFYEDFITLVMDQARLLHAISAGKTRGVSIHGGAPVEQPQALEEARRLQPFFTTATGMQKSKIIRMRADQTAVFLDTPLVEGQDYKTWLRLPFDYVYVQPEQPVQFRGYVSDDVHNRDLRAEIEAAPSGEEKARLEQLLKMGDPVVRGVLLVELDGKSLTAARAREQFKKSTMASLLSSHPAYGADDIKRVIAVVFLMPLPEFFMNIHGLNIGIRKDNTLVIKSTGHPGTQQRMLQWAVHTINFLSSPSVKLVATAPAPGLVKARQRSGKPPIPGWYEITYRRHVQEYSKGKIATGGFKQWEHSYRYDVHGHFKRFTRGRMAGRVLWCPPHQRGLKHDLYKPKGYRQEGLR